MTNNSLPAGIYRHYKGNEYRVIGIAKHSETLEDLVMYECLYDNPQSQNWVRSLSMFRENVVVDGVPQSRFRFIRSE